MSCQWWYQFRSKRLVDLRPLMQERVASPGKTEMMSRVVVASDDVVLVFVMLFVVLWHRHRGQRDGEESCQSGELHLGLGAESRKEVGGRDGIDEMMRRRKEKLEVIIQGERETCRK